METEFPKELDAFARGYLTSAARRLDATVPCVPCDAEDYLQDLQLNLWKRQPKFDATRSRWTTFVRLVTDHRAIELRFRCLRGRCHAQAPVVTLGDKATEWPDRESNLDSLRLDMAAWVESLDPDEQKLCRSLMRNSTSETARELDFPRTTVIDKISRLCKRYERTSLRDYSPHAKNLPTANRSRPVG